MIFQPDNGTARIAEAYALDAVEFAADAFSVSLDWSDGSIQRVEEILAILHRSMPNEKPSEDVIWNFAKGFGSYIGEVLRMHHGGEWGIVTNDGASFPGMRWNANAESAETIFWPWGRAHDRLVKGEENNVWHYYKWLLGSTPFTKDV